ncbi:MAG TPA: peptidoglycan editing factor PgeF [Anaerolineales bacterium]|nr:peptidoglycan editing factor PgeF [Anaerolineales bacterium]
MPFHQVDTLRYLTFDLFDQAGIRHAVFTRRGGVSPAPWASLNVGGLVGDLPECVTENRRRSFAALGSSLDSLYDVWQVHSAEVVIAEAPRSGAPHHQADAILTDHPGVTLYMRFADCTPVLLVDPEHHAVGLVHAGWQGTVKKIAAAAVAAMQARYGSRPGALLAAIGPSIGPHHYPVGPDVVARVEQAFGSQAPALLENPPDRSSGQSGVQFDLWSANRLVLEAAGVRQIEVSQICTACHLEDWYSHRGEQGRTGRFGALIAVE